MVHRLLLILEKMEEIKHCIFLMTIVIMVLQQAACRICPPGELQYTDNDMTLCCKPKLLCLDETYVTKCTTNHTQEICKDCPQGKTLAYKSSSFDRKICYDIPSCKGSLPDIKSINATTCACNWSNQLVHEEPDNPILDLFNCQFRKKCSKGKEPIVDSNGCNKCKHGFYQEDDNSLEMCMRWKNCTALDLGVSKPGTDKHDAVCLSSYLTTAFPPTIHTETTSTTDNTTTTVEITNTTFGPPRPPLPDPPPDPPPTSHTPNIIIGVIAVAVAVAVAGVVVLIWWKRRSRRPPEGDPELPPEHMELISGSTVQTAVSDTSYNPQGPSSNGTIPIIFEASNGGALLEGGENGQALFSNGSMLPQDQSELSVVDNPADRGLQTVPKQTDADPFANTTRKTVDIDENNPQTVPKLVDNPSKYGPPSGAQPGTSPTGDDTNPKVLTKTRSTSSDGSSSGRPVYSHQVSNVSGTLPDGPITGETSKKCAVVNPVPSQQNTGHGREGEENDDNSNSLPSHVTSSPVRSSMPSGDNGVARQQAVSPFPSFHPPPLRDGGSLSEESGRLNSR